MPHDIQPYNFDEQELFEMPFRYKGIDYIMREASTEAARLYRNKMANAAKWSPDGQLRSMGNVADVETFLVSMCVFTKGKIKAKDGSEKDVDVAVNEAVVKSWPSKMTSKIFKDLIKVSELQSEDTEDSLVTEITELQTKLDELRAKKAKSEEDSSKNAQSLSTNTSE